MSYKQGHAAASESESYAKRTHRVNAKSTRKSRKQPEMVEDVLMDEEPGDRLKRARIKKGIASAREAARLFGIPEPTYACIENKYRKITPKRAEQLSPKLGVTPEWLLYGRGPVDMPQQKQKNLSYKVNFFLARELACFMSICDGEHPESQKIIMIDGIIKLPEQLICVPAPDGAMQRDRFPSFPEGMVLFIEPRATVRPEDYRPGDVVQAVIAGRTESVFREYTRRLGPTDQMQIVLKAYDSRYEDIIFDASRGDRIVGLVLRGGLYLDL